MERILLTVEKIRILTREYIENDKFNLDKKLPRFSDQLNVIKYFFENNCRIEVVNRPVILTINNEKISLVSRLFKNDIEMVDNLKNNKTIFIWCWFESNNQNQVPEYLVRLFYSKENIYAEEEYLVK